MLPRATLLALLVSLAFCTPPAAQPGPVTTEERAEVADRIGTLLAERYVFADKGVEAGAYVRERIEAGAYDGVTEPDSFAAVLTRDLQHVTRDKHLRVRHRAPQQGPGGPPDPLRERLSQRERNRAANLGIQSVEILDGNVGYLDLRFFPPEEDVREAYDAALRLLANVDALIIDERQHGGGSPSGIRYLTSYFFDAPTHLNSLHWREGDTENVEEFWTHTDIGGTPRPDLPLFVLTSDYTFSGAEEFANNLKELGRATIVGETTGGGANPGGLMPAGQRFGVFVPVGRAVNPISGTNWEGVGVAPDVEVPAEDALDRALELARPAATAYDAAREQRLETQITVLETGMADAAAAFDAGRDASAQVATLLRTTLDTGLMDEPTINGYGYLHLQSERPALAVAIFRFNVQTFPESWNVYDSLGEALAAQGETDEAKRMYEKARALAPNDQHGRIDDMLERL
ncbi:MAG: S41 family peptidase [Rhodothermales bacterium]